MGALQIIGDYLQLASGILSIEIDRNLPDGQDVDQLQVSRTATLGGTLNVSTTETVTRPLSIGDTFVILTCSTDCIGTFEAVNGIELGSGRVLEVRYGDKEVMLEVVENAVDVEPENWIVYLPTIIR